MNTHWHIKLCAYTTVDANSWLGFLVHLLYCPHQPFWNWQLAQCPPDYTPWHPVKCFLQVETEGKGPSFSPGWAVQALDPQSLLRCKGKSESRSKLCLQVLQEWAPSIPQTAHIICLWRPPHWNSLHLLLPWWYRGKLRCMPGCYHNQNQMCLEVLRELLPIILKELLVKKNGMGHLWVENTKNAIFVCVFRPPGREKWQKLGLKIKISKNHVLRF